MGASVVTFSPNVALGDAERMVRARVARDGIAAVAARIGDRRQVRQLRRLRGRLAADPQLNVVFSDLAGGAAVMAVWTDAVRYPAWWGEPKTGAPSIPNTN